MQKCYCTRVLTISANVDVLMDESMDGCCAFRRFAEQPKVEVNVDVEVTFGLVGMPFQSLVQARIIEASDNSVMHRSTTYQQPECARIYWWDALIAPTEECVCDGLSSASS